MDGWRCGLVAIERGRAGGLPLLVAVSDTSLCAMGMCAMAAKGRGAAGLV